jgi:hypothetical protein
LKAEDREEEEAERECVCHGNGNMVLISHVCTSTSRDDAFLCEVFCLLQGHATRSGSPCRCR